MSKHPILNVAARTSVGTGKLNQLRREGFIPCNFYGSKAGNSNLQVNERELSQLLATSASEHMIVDLKMDGKSKLALVKELQRDSLKDAILHVDFLAVTDNTEITSAVPVTLEGEAPGVALGGLLEQLIHELTVKCQVKNLPETISADVSSLEIGMVLRISDLKLPKGVTAVLPEDNLVAIVEEPKLKGDAEGAPAAEAAAPAGQASTEA